MEVVFEKIKAFIIKTRWEYDFPLKRELSLQNDLLIYGDDADEFILAFSKEFDVDVSQFRIEDYFKSEGFLTLSGLIESLTGRKKHFKSLTIGDLEKAVIVGQLNDKVISS